MKIVVSGNGMESCKQESSESQKILVMNKIIGYFLPLFNQEIEREKQQFDQNNRDLEKLNHLTKSNSEELKKIKFQMKKEELIENILSEVIYLRDYESLYGQTRQIVNELLFDLYELSYKELTFKYEKLKKISHRNVKKVLSE